MYVKYVAKLRFFCLLSKNCITFVAFHEAMQHKYTTYIIFLAFLALSCTGGEKPTTTPWGTADDATAEDGKHGQSPSAHGTYYSLEEIVDNGEMIVLTLTGPDTYYDYRGRGMGVQYMMCENFAREIGVTLRVELCKDTTELIAKLQSGDGDIIAVPLPKGKGSKAGGKGNGKQKLRFCGAYDKSRNTQWAVAAGNESLAERLDSWYEPEMAKRTLAFEDYLLSQPVIHSASYVPVKTFTPTHSSYTTLFQRYAPAAGIDWHLLAAQCYQESAYDAMARSWAGAMGLMQLMPATAKSLGLSADEVWEPEKNIAAGARLMGRLLSDFSDVPDRAERINFALASYNGGSGHVRDAMALARKYGEDAHRWSVVADYLLKLSLPEYYQDHVVRYGYMRGKETVGYVRAIRSRYGG